MINRILIRTKVVQLLYSYFITEKHFSLETVPTPPSKEKRFAYQMYLDTLAMMTVVSNMITRQGGHKPLRENRFMDVVANEDKIKAVLARTGSEEGLPLARLAGELAVEIKESGIYKNYVKDKSDRGNGDVKVWQEIFRFIIWPNPMFNSLASRLPNYSLSGMDRMKALMENTFVNFLSSQSNIPDALNQLGASLEKARELYFRLLLLPVALTDVYERQVEENRSKLLPTEADLNPNMKLLENRLVRLIRENTMVSQYAETNKINLEAENMPLLKALLKSILSSEVYKNYIEEPFIADDAADGLAEEKRLEQDCNFWRNTIKEVILSNDYLLEELENMSVFWNDDLDIMADFVLKTIRRFEEGMGQSAVLQKYKNEDDARFGRGLFTYVLKNKEDYKAILQENLNTAHWDTERLALMDVIIIYTAIAEMLNFPSIPLKVTVNEYIEIAKSYSSAKSGSFINGFLGVIIKELQEQKRLLKKD